MTWELIQVEDTDCTIDDSGLYVTIHRVTTKQEGRGYAVSVRADLMGTGDEPIVSFIGKANNVRKHLIQYIFEHYGCAAISMEHASYIGYELLRAELMPNFVQD